MLIFGSGSRKKKIGEGEFFCPKCETRRVYHHKKATRYFTLYFIPLIPMGDLGEFIECQTCKTAFQMGVLSLRAPSAAAPTAARQTNAAQLLNAISDRLDRGEPVEYLVRDMTAAGMDRDVALKTVNAFTGSGKACRDCGFTYSDKANQCVGCGKAL